MEMRCKRKIFYETKISSEYALNPRANLHEMLFLGATTKQQWHQLQQIQCHHELSVESFFLLEHNKTVQTM